MAGCGDIAGAHSRAEAALCIAWAPFTGMSSSTCVCLSLYHLPFRDMPAGSRPFAGITSTQAVRCLRALLQEMEVPEAGLYRTHDFRRGHAHDLQMSGAPLSVILEAGEWRSATCPQQCYMDSVALEASTVLEAHMAESDGSDSD